MPLTRPIPPRTARANFSWVHRYCCNTAGRPRRPLKPYFFWKPTMSAIHRTDVQIQKQIQRQRQAKGKPETSMMWYFWKGDDKGILDMIGDRRSLKKCRCKDKHKYKDKNKNSRQSHDVICFWKGMERRVWISRKCKYLKKVKHAKYPKYAKYANQDCTNCGSLAARKWRENEKMKRKWRERMRKWRGNGERFTLYIFSFSLFFLLPYPFPIYQKLSQVVAKC